MEGICRWEIKPEPPPPPPADVNCGNELNRSDSDSEASSWSGDKRGRVFRRSENVKQEDRTRWTNEKHNLYLKNLEVSFVKQLYQSMNLLSQCSEQSNTDRDISQMQSINGANSYEQFGCGRKADHKRRLPLSRVSADSHIRQNLGKSIASYGLQTCSQQFSASCHNVVQEGIGQNFVEEVIQDKSNCRSRGKRLKRDLADSSVDDQIVPSKNSHTAD